MKYPNFFFERKLWRRGYKFVAGVDEVGRGSFAGAVVAGCAVFDKRTKPQVRIDDSKKLSPRKRQMADKWIKENAQAWGIGEAGVGLINRIGMGKATKVAFRRAVAQANKKLEVRSKKLDVILSTSNIRHRTSNIRIQYLLIDAFYIPYVKGLKKKRQKPIIHGDAKSLTIGAASIIAKVYRDNLMLRLSKKPKFRKYGWGRNKGYGTKEHQKAILKYGACRYHRKQFVNSFVSSQAR